MSDWGYTLLGVLCEFVLPVTLLIWLVIAPSARKRLAVVLGAMTPAVLFYMCIVVSFVAAPQNQGNRFAFHALPMLCPLVPILGLMGLGASLLKRPENLFGRYAVGWAAAGCYAVISILTGRLLEW